MIGSGWSEVSGCGSRQTSACSQENEEALAESEGLWRYEEKSTSCGGAITGSPGNQAAAEAHGLDG